MNKTETENDTTDLCLWLDRSAPDGRRDHSGLSDLKKFLADLWETMYEADGVGLAAPQVGKSVRIFVVDVAPGPNEKGITPSNRHSSTRSFTNVSGKSGPSTKAA